MNTIDVTMSGYPLSEIYLSNHVCIDFHYKDDNRYWKLYDKPTQCTLSLLSIESFKQLSFPLIDVKVTSKKVSWLKRFWYSGWKNEMLYKVEIDIIGRKDVILVNLASGRTIYIDGSAEMLKNALEGISISPAVDK